MSLIARFAIIADSEHWPHTVVLKLFLQDSIHGIVESTDTRFASYINGNCSFCDMLLFSLIPTREIIDSTWYHTEQQHIATRIVSYKQRYNNVRWLSRGKLLLKENDLMHRALYRIVIQQHKLKRQQLQKSSFRLTVLRLV